MWKKAIRDYLVLKMCDDKNVRMCLGIEWCEIGMAHFHTDNEVKGLAAQMIERIMGCVDDGERVLGMDEAQVTLMALRLEANRKLLEIDVECYEFLVKGVVYDY